MSRFKKTVLANGVRVVTENGNHSKSVAIGVWVETGTRDEADDEVGISHFVEHLVFKGTKKRTAYQIAKSLEFLGGDLNAYTTREHTNYHCLVLKDDWKSGLEVLADLVCNMKISNKDFELEKKVILQEIAMSDDTPEDIIYDYLYENVYANHPLGRQILGKSYTISKMTQKRIYEFYKKYYQGKNLIVSLSGDVDHDAVVVECQKLFKSKKPFKQQINRRAPVWKSSRNTYEKDAEQSHILVALPAASFRDKLRFEAFIVNSILGGGMTSRLYQSIREKNGLAYSVFSMLNTQDDSGNLTIYAGTEPKTVKKVIHLIHDELLKIKKNGLTQKELDMYKTQVKGQLLIGSDDVDNRMTSLGINEMIFGQYKSVESVIKEFDKITVASVKSYLKNHFDLTKVACVLMGPDAEKLSDWLKNYDFSKKRT